MSATTVQASFGSSDTTAHLLTDAQFNAVYEGITGARAIAYMVAAGGADDLSDSMRTELFGGLYQLLDSAARGLMNKESGSTR